MENTVTSIRPFVGAKDFVLSRSFYRDLEFEEIAIDKNMSLFTYGKVGFYLQDAYVKDWIENTMIFMEVNNADEFYENLVALKLTEKYNTARSLPIKVESWGKECFLIDPSGILWHFGQFFKSE